MITIRFAGRMPQPMVFSIGQETDQDAEKIRFLLPQVADNQTAALVMLLPDGSGEALNIVDGVATVSSAMTEQPGRIRAWVEIMGGGIAWNSEMMYMDVGDLPPISEVVERDYPTAFQEALAAAGVIENDYTQIISNVEQAGGLMSFSVDNNGDLWLWYYDSDDPPVFEITDGDLYYVLNEEDED